MSVLAVFGGSFDPPHIGHVLAATWVLSTRAVDALLVVPTFQHAFDKRLAPFAHRRRMVELAFGCLRAVEVSDLEARLSGVSYTVRTLEHLAAARPGVRLRLMIGSDLVDQLPSWREGHRLAELAPPLVVGRGSHPSSETPIAIGDVSSTLVRRRILGGEPIDHLVPRAVAEYLTRHRLYPTTDEQ